MRQKGGKTEGETSQPIHYLEVQLNEKARILFTYPYELSTLLQMNTEDKHGFLITGKVI